MRDRLRLPAIAIAGKEIAAFARQALLLRHDIAEPVLPANARDGDDIVILLHGLFATAGVLRPLSGAIARHAGGRGARAARGSEAPAVHTATLSYPPGPGVEALAARLSALSAALPARARLHLVGHSLGGIVCRHFAQESGDPRVVQTISLATPFGGVPRAGFLGFEGARDLDPASPLLRRIRLGGARPGIPHLSIVAGADTLVRSPISHALPGGEVRVMPACGHNTLLFDREVAALVAQRVLDRRGFGEGPAPAGGGPGLARALDRAPREDPEDEGGGLAVAAE